jgi:hypothetical protein
MVFVLVLMLRSMLLGLAVLGMLAFLMLAGTVLGIASIIRVVAARPVAQDVGASSPASPAPQARWSNRR